MNKQIQAIQPNLDHIWPSPIPKKYQCPRCSGGGLLDDGDNFGVVLIQCPNCRGTGIKQTKKRHKRRSKK